MHTPRSRLFRRRLPAWIVIALALVLVAGAPAAAWSSVITAGPHSVRRVALTFDDGWEVGACARIANTLRANHAVGTFFINGMYVAGARSQWRRVLDGMDVGNHTRAHLDLARLSSSEIRHQISSNEELLEQVLGRPILKLLRPPFGSYDDQVRQVASSLGYQRIVLWNHDTLDWSSSSSVSGVIARATAGGSGAIVLMHCGPGVTVRALPAIIHSYRQRGYQLVGLSTLLGMPRRS